MSYTQKALTLLLGIFLLLGLFWFLVYQPRANQLERLKKENKEFDRKIHQAETEKAKLPQARKEIEDIKQKIERLEVQYPKTIEPIYQAITDADRKTGFGILNKDMDEKPRAGKEDLAVRELDIEIKASCPYRVLGEFLDEISHLPVVVSVSGLNINRDEVSISQLGVVPDLEIDLRLTTYLSKE